MYVKRRVRVDLGGRSRDLTPDLRESRILGVYEVFVLTFCIYIHKSHGRTGKKFKKYSKTFCENPCDRIIQGVSDCIGVRYYQLLQIFNDLK